MKIVGIIPARYKSSRFPGKPLALIYNKPMIIYVAEIASQALGKENTYVATDDERIKECVESYGFNAVMTAENCLTGTDRLWDFAQKISADIYINIQGDEPLLNYNDINLIAQKKKEKPEYIINGMASIGEDEEPTDINIPKVLVNKNNDLIYMSRLAIPGKKDIHNPHRIDYKKQICIYAFNYKELKAFGTTSKKAEYEFYEDIEILRFLDLNIPIHMVELSGNSIAVDNPKDIARVEAKISENKNNKQ